MSIMTFVDINSTACNTVSFTLFSRLDISILIWNIETKVSKWTLMLWHQCHISMFLLINKYPLSMKLRNANDNAVHSCPLSIDEIFCSWNDFIISKISRCARNTRLVTKTPVTYMLLKILLCVKFGGKIQHLLSQKIFRFTICWLGFSED